MIYNFNKKEYGIWSYPPVFEFDMINDREEYNRHFQELDVNEQIKIYIHIPFCITKCLFCPFYKERFSNIRSNELDDYFNMLCK